jgi:hypothetical protein
MNEERFQEEERRLSEELIRDGFSGIAEWVNTFWDSGTGWMAARIVLWNNGFSKLCTPEGMEYLVKKYGPKENRE